MRIRFNFDIKRRYYDCVEYFVTKYDFTNKNIKPYYNDLLYLSKRKYFEDMIKDKTYICKGFKRKILDKLFMNRFYAIIALWTFKIKNIFVKIINRYNNGSFILVAIDYIFLYGISCYSHL